MLRDPLRAQALDLLDRLARSAPSRLPRSRNNCDGNRCVKNITHADT
jgi:hypothetical protein